MMRPPLLLTALLLTACLGAVSCSSTKAPAPPPAVSMAPPAVPPAPAPPPVPPAPAAAPEKPATRPAVTAAPQPPPGPAIYKTDAQWRAQLTEEQYRVTRRKDTEAKFSGEYVNHTAAGTYRCVCCGAKLFASAAKFDHGCGWPNFTSALGQTATRTDISYGMKRTEVYCAKCEAHLGHLFNDGPRPSGKRYCVNSVALKFEPKANPPKP